MKEVYIINLARRVKPMLKAIFPENFLRGIKEKIIDHRIKKMILVKKRKDENKYYKNGINLIGDVKAEIGLGQSCRLLANMLKTSKVDFGIFDYQLPGVPRSKDTRWNAYISKELLYDINLIHINPFELKTFFLETEMKMWQSRYNIGFWLWELEEFPDEWLMCAEMLDEIWTPSEFASSSIRKKVKSPVNTIPYWITTPCEERYDRKYFNLPEDKFLFLTMYDCNSTIERKNPIATISAYKQAFPKEAQDVGFVIKMNNAKQDEIALVRSKLQQYENVYIIQDTLKKEEVNSLIKAVDVFSSLHRAEGFGLVLAEAMQVGTPTIATNWSSNVEFMTSDVACMVDYEFQILNHDSNLYKKGSRWANPIVSEAATYMIKLYEDKAYYDRIKQAGQKYIENVLGRERTITILEERIGKICKER